MIKSSTCVKINKKRKKKKRKPYKNITVGSQSPNLFISLREIFAAALT